MSTCDEVISCFFYKSLNLKARRRKSCKGYKVGVVAWDHEGIMLIILTKKSSAACLGECLKSWPNPNNNTTWWFQPISKILTSQNGNLPQVGVKIKK